MTRGSFVAVLIGLLAAVGLIAAVARDDDTDSAATGAEDGSAEAASASDGDGDDVGEFNSEMGRLVEPDLTAPTTAAAEAPPKLGQAGTLENVDAWLQTDATSFEDFDGKVRIVQFWTFACFNCHATFPHLREIYAEHEGDNFEIIGVHAPEFDFERDIDAVQEAAIEDGVVWPIAIDNSKTNFRAWQPGRRFWPRTFVLDQNGEIRFDRIGEGKYDELAATVELLLENGP